MITTVVLNEDTKRPGKIWREAKKVSSAEWERAVQQGEPIYRVRETEERLDVAFRVTSEESALASMFVYQFIIEVSENKGEIYRAQSVPIIVTEPWLREKALYLLICHVFKRKKNISEKELKRLFKLLSTRIDFVKRCFRNHPWEGNRIDGRHLPEILFWFTKCCETFKACRILFDYSIMFGFLSRAKTEEILGGVSDGSFMFRIGSGEVGGLVMSTRLNGKFIHVTISPASDLEVLKQLTVPSLTKVMCYDTTPLPKRNLIGLYKAEGIKIPSS